MKSAPSKKNRKPATPKVSPDKKKDFVTWFEIPAFNFERALKFYNFIFDMDMETSEVNGYHMAFFPADGGVSGAIICGEASTPSDKGPLVYLNAGNVLDEVISRIEEAGGQLLMSKTFINEEAGHFALFLDSEGNKLALHAKT